MKTTPVLVLLSAVLISGTLGCSRGESVSGAPDSGGTQSVAAPSSSAAPSSPSDSMSAAPPASVSTTATTSPTPSASTSASPSTSASTSANVSCPLPDRWRGEDVTRLPTERKVVALTFDAGANADAVAPVLATLKAKQVPATFFLTGDFVREFPEQTRQIVATGEPIGNHSMTHPELTKLSSEKMRAELTSAEQAIRAASGRDPRPYFRFPFGDVNSRTIEVANSLCYVPFRWTADTLGWQGTSGGMTAEKVVDRVMTKAQPGEIVLMHLGSNPKDRSVLDADALPVMIDRLRERGYDFVTLEEMFR